MLLWSSAPWHFCFGEDSTGRGVKDKTGKDGTDWIGGPPEPGTIGGKRCSVAGALLPGDAAQGEAVSKIPLGGVQWHSGMDGLPNGRRESAGGGYRKPRISNTVDNEK